MKKKKTKKSNNNWKLIYNLRNERNRGIFYQWNYFIN